MMGFMLALLMVPALVQNDDDAEKQILGMEKKLGAAKTLQVSFEADVEGLVGFGTLKGTLTVAAGNKIHLDGAFWNDDKKTDNWKIVSDGAHMKREGLRLDATKPASKKLTENYRSSLTHGGYHMQLFVSSEGPQESWPIFRASEFKLEGKEKVGKRQAHVIVCKLTPLEKNDTDKRTWSESLWIDVETNLPLKRIVACTFEGKKATFTESYTTFSVDPKIDAMLFELPK
jgi:hypothetical protein